MSQTNLSAAEIISITNVYRQSAGLLPLTPDPKLDQAALIKATTMLATHSWSHTFQSHTPWEYLEKVDYQYQYAGENLARNFTSATDVVEAWMNSESHKQNLLNPHYTQTGVAVVPDPNNENQLLIVQYLATPLTQTTSEGSSSEPLFATTKLLSPNLSYQTILITAFIIGFVGTIIVKRIKVIFKNKKSKNHKPSDKFWRQ